MSDQTAQEPTMEEILASIRRIISEDDAPAETAAAPAPEAEAAPAPAAEPQAAPQAEPTPPAEAEVSPAMMDETPSMQEPAASEEDVLELTDDDRAETIGDLDVTPAPEPEPAPAAAPAPEPDPFPAAAPTAYAPDPAPATAAAVSALTGGTTVEELVRSIVEPQVKAWLDQNLDALLRDILRERLDRVFR